jgi:hypothetical protein
MGLTNGAPVPSSRGLQDFYHMAGLSFSGMALRCGSALSSEFLSQGIIPK